MMQLKQRAASQYADSTILFMVTMQIRLQCIPEKTRGIPHCTVKFSGGHCLQPQLIKQVLSAMKALHS
jgi:hypothetical protein